MDRYYNINPFNRRYSEDELREIGERYHAKEAEADVASRREEKRYCHAGPFERVTSGQLLLAAGRLLGLGG